MDAKKDLKKIDKNLVNNFIYNSNPELIYNLNIFFENYSKINEINFNKYDKIYNNLVTDSIIQFYIIKDILENEIKKINKINLIKDFNLVDIGTGFGIPGLIIAILYQNYKQINTIDFNLNIHLIESNQKKCRFLNNLKKELNLEIEIINMDCKEYIKKVQRKFELVISRAVFKMPNIIDIYKKYSNLFAFWLYSQNYEELLEKYKNKINQYFEIFKIYEYEINNNVYYTIAFLKK
ncbi:MAG: RsmG family class I SAM-dependent methyltransferase [bacterium]